MKRLSKFLLTLSTFSLPAAAAEQAIDSQSLRTGKTINISLIDGPTVDGGVRVGYYLSRNTVLEAAYLEEKNLFANEYNSTSRAYDFGLRQFFGNSFYSSLALRGITIESYNNNHVAPEISLWQKDLMARVGFGNQWQLIEGVSIGFEWLSIAGNLNRLDHSSHVYGSERQVEDKLAQALRDEKKENRWSYSFLRLEVGYSF